jgi:FKBP-type peptidyl-prolyl cis-trans isomerase
MHRTGSLAFILALSIGLAACGGGGGSKATPTPTSTPTPQPIPTLVGEPTVTASGLKIIDTLVGTGTEAKAGDSLTVQYTGYLEDGTIFDGPAIHGGPASFSLTRAILGWQEGVPGMKAGGKRRLIIPPALAYGATGRPGIPPNATLTFDVELLSVP